MIKSGDPPPPKFGGVPLGRNLNVKKTCRALGIRKTHTSAYHSQGNLLVERSNRTILQMLRCYVNESWEWEKYLPLKKSIKVSSFKVS